MLGVSLSKFLVKLPASKPLHLLKFIFCPFPILSCERVKFGRTLPLKSLFKQEKLWLVIRKFTIAISWKSCIIFIFW